MTSRKKIAFIVNFLTHYRLSFYEKLSLHQDYEWLFVHGVKERQDGRPSYRGPISFPNRPVGYEERRAGPFYVRWQAGVLSLIREWRPDVVITLGIPSTISNWLAMDWARRHGGTTVSWHCAWEPQLGNAGSLALKQWLSRKYLGLADHVLVYSTKGSRYLQSLGCPPEQLTVCYNGLEIDGLLARESQYRAKGKLLREHYHLNGRRLFLYVGGMMPEKQVPFLLDAFQSTEGTMNAVLWLVGDGPDLPAMREMVRTRNLHSVKFWGRVTDDVDALFAAADFFVLPGLGGLALNQALFWGVPCVAGDADGTEDDLVLEGRTGFRFSAMNRDSLRRALGKCLDLEESTRAAWGATGRALVTERSNVNQMVDTFIRTINVLTSPK